MKLKEKINILFTGTRTFREEKARLETLQRVYGSQNAVFANNGTSETEEKEEAIIEKVEVKNKEGKTITYASRILAGEPVIYTATVKGKEGKTLTAEELEEYKKNVNWIFWVGGTKVEFASKDEKGALRMQRLFSKSDLKADMTTTILNDKDEITCQTIDNCYLQFNISSSEEGKAFKDTLTITWSKWLDEVERVRVEAYIDHPKKTSSSNKAACSRIVKAQPEIIEAYWINSTRKKLTTAGYNQDIYLYINTLGLNGQTLEVGVYDKDYYPNPTVALNRVVEFYARKETDDLITWKNNKIDIKDRETIKQFKVGDKHRYKEALQGEDKEYAQKNKKEWYTMVFDYTEKTNFDLDLYVYIENSKKLGFVNPKAEYGKLLLSHDEKICDAFFAEIEKETVQADAPEEDIKNKKKKVIGKKRPTTKVPYYKKLNKGVLGQKIQLVVACSNLERKTVTFEVFEVSSLLEDLGSKLSFVFKGEENQNIKVLVKDGYAVAEIELKHCKEDTDNEDWENILDPEKGRLQTSFLYIKTSYVGAVKIEKEFLKEKGAFELLPAVSVYRIYKKGEIINLYREEAKKGRYYYYDSSNKEHYLGKYNYKKITNNYFWNKKYGNTKKINLVDLKHVKNYSNGAVKFGITLDTTRPYVNEFTLASLLGAMLECGFEDFVCNGFSKKDGSSSPSVSHLNGFHGDFKYLRLDKAIKTGIGSSLKINIEPEELDFTRQNQFNDALKKFGWTNFLGWTYTLKGKKHKLNHIPKNTKDHNHHLHVEKYNHNFIKTEE